MQVLQSELGDPYWSTPISCQLSYQLYDSGSFHAPSLFTKTYNFDDFFPFGIVQFALLRLYVMNRNVER